MVKPIVIPTSDGPVYWWNLGANVGARSPNHPEDVQLVQFGYFCMLNNPRNASLLKPEERAAFAAVKIGPSCTGQENDPLVIAIRAHEKSRGGAQDGHVSVAPPGQVVYDGVHTFILNVLVTNIRVVTKTDFPRFDKHPACKEAAKLIEAVKKACGAD